MSLKIIDSIRWNRRRKDFAKIHFVEEYEGCCWCIIDDSDIHNVYCRSLDFRSTALFCLSTECKESDLFSVRVL